MEPDDPKVGRSGVIAQPSQGQLIRDGEDHQRVRGGMPAIDHIWVGDSEVQRRVRRLAGLRPGSKIGTGDQVEAGENIALAVRHEQNRSCPGTQAPSALLRRTGSAIPPAPGAATF